MERQFLFFVICLLIPFISYNQEVKSIYIEGFSSSNFVGYVPNQIVINFDNTLRSQIARQRAENEGLTGVSRLDQIASQYHARSILQKYPNTTTKEYQGKFIDLNGWFTIRFSEEVDVEQVAQSYKQIPGVIDAQPIGIHTVDAIPNDYNFNMQWHLNQLDDHDVDAPEAWDVQTGNSGIIVGVMDTGVRYFHRDLGGSTASLTTPENSRGNMWINQVELSSGIPNGIDDDGNGYVDDWIGWDFVTNIILFPPYSSISGEDYSTQDNDPRDFNGHGTHCAGNIGALNNNGYATAAISGGWGNGTLQQSGNGVKVMALRIGYSANYPSYGEVGLVSMAAAAGAFRYAADNGARIVSCSWGSSNTGGLGAAIDYYLASGGLIFKAAGNDGNSTADYICGRSDLNIISVAATDTLDRKADFSNYGTWVDISAPGTGIWSSYHVHTDPSRDYIASLNGTSMATPIAASTAALIWSVNPSVSADEVRQILYNYSDDIDYANPGYVGLLGAGRVNAYNPLLDSSLPVVLSSFTVKGDLSGIILEWETKSEIENLGFEILRKAEDQKDFFTIASYLTNDQLKGLGNSTIGQKYFYKDTRIDQKINYWYKLVDVDINGKRTEHGPLSILVGSGGSSTLASFARDQYYLFPNFPNPFNAGTYISFNLPENKIGDYKTRVIVYNMVGEEVRTLLNDDLSAGMHKIYWDGKNDRGNSLASGIYFYAIQTESFKQYRKMIMLK